MEEEVKEKLAPVVIDESDVPEVIGNQFQIMQEYRANLDIAKAKADLAKTNANQSKDKKTGVFKNKEAIESLQDTTLSLAEAQIVATEVQEKSFEYQKKLGEITKYLFGLGVSNIASNRMVVHELEMRLKNASEEEIDDMAREEITNLVKQLKMQEDVLKKQIELSGKLKEHDVGIKAQTDKDKEQDAKLTALSLWNKELKDRVSKLEEENTNLKETVKRNSKNIMMIVSIATVIALIGLILGFISLFI